MENQSAHKNHDGISWKLLLRSSGQADTLVTAIPSDLSQAFAFETEIDGTTVTFALTPHNGFCAFSAQASRTTGKIKAQFVVQAHYTDQTPFNFNGEVAGDEIFRQSPHDLDAWITDFIAKQPIPVIALLGTQGFVGSLCDSPAFYDNFTSQGFFLDEQVLELCSGDSGKQPGLKLPHHLEVDYNLSKSQVMSPGKVLAHDHTIAPGAPHVFKGLFFHTAATDYSGLRREVNHRVAQHFTAGRVNEYFGSLAFSTAYMNLRSNDSGRSKYWVVPAVEYANVQYGRDAFWIATMLPPELSAECLKSELAEINLYAEYPLFAVIWAYRDWLAKAPVDLGRVQAFLDAIDTKKARAGWFYGYDEKDGRLDFQHWGDIMAFDIDDPICYNQGLYAMAMAAGRDMGLATGCDPEIAAHNYRALYNVDLGFYPVSQKKNMILSPDVLIGDLLSQIYRGVPLLERATVESHYREMVSKSKTAWGFRTVCMPDGSYLPWDMYDATNYIAQINREADMPDGRYFRGGSYFLYDNLFLLDAFLHGIDGVEEQVKWRIGLDFSIGATTYECLNTKNGEPWKPNMGWNAAIYAFWRKLVDDGRASPDIFATVDMIVSPQAE